MLDETIRDRALGAVLGAAVGDALGASYEFLSATEIADQGEIEMRAGATRLEREKGEWTDDTAMSTVILQTAATHHELRSATALDSVAAGFQDWAESNPPAIGAQTKRVLGASGACTAEALLRDSKHLPGTRKGGNGSLMRTAPVALPYLGEGKGGEAVEAAGAISDLTHYDLRARQACRLWTNAIRHAILVGPVQGVPAYLQNYADTEEQRFWVKQFQVAEQPDVSAHVETNGWVVDALVCAWHAIATTPGRGSEHFQAALRKAVSLGQDTDTVASIAGALLGACWGASAIPEEWTVCLHGYPGWTVSDLERLVDATLAAQ